MAQTPVTRHQNDGNTIDYTPGSAVNAGDVIIVGKIPYVAPVAIAAGILGALEGQGEYKVPKDTSVFAQGDPVYWNPTGSPVTGTAASGCATSVAAGAVLMGMATVAALTGDSYVNTMHNETSGVRGGTTPTQVVAAAGSTQADAAAVTITNGLVNATGADGTKGIILPAGSAGKSFTLKNSDAANAILKVYPPTGGVINALATNGAISMAAKTSAVFSTIDGTTWFTTPLLPS